MTVATAMTAVDDVRAMDTAVRERHQPERARPERKPTHRRRRTRADYLDTALVLADERARMAMAPYAYAVAHVDMAHVAEAAGVSRTALYRLWETQEAFRADLTAYLAAHDEAPWTELDPELFAAPLAYPDQFVALTRRRLNAEQAQLATDPWPLLRAGLAGYPEAAPVTAIVAQRERQRLDRHATVVEQALRSTGRRCRAGILPADISVVTASLADGLSLAARMTPPSVPLVAGRGGPQPWSLLALAVCALFDGLTEPDPDGHEHGHGHAASRSRHPASGGRPAVPGSGSTSGSGSQPSSADEPQPEQVGQVGQPEHPSPPAPAEQSGQPGPAGQPGPTGRRLHYLRLAAELATATHPHDPPTDSGALGYVGLDALARAEGVTRAAVRKMWPTQAAFRSDLFAHLLARHRAAVVQHLTGSPVGSDRDRSPEPLPDAGPDDPTGPTGLDARLLHAGDALLDQIHATRARVSHLTFAPQLVLPAFRADVHRHVDPLLDRAAVALTSLLSAHGRKPRREVAGRRLAVLVLALIDGVTRVARTDPALVRRHVGAGNAAGAGDVSGDGPHGLLAIALDRLVRGLSRPV